MAAGRDVLFDSPQVHVRKLTHSEVNQSQRGSSQGAAEAAVLNKTVEILCEAAQGTGGRVS